MTHNLIEFGASDIHINTIIDDLKYGDINDKISFYLSATKHLENKRETIEKFIDNKGIEEVIILGHSLLGDDLYYFRKILIPRYRKKLWTLYYYDENDKKAKENFAKENRLEKYKLKKFKSETLI